jgi:uncharacterized membrane protein YkoI
MIRFLLVPVLMLGTWAALDPGPTALTAAATELAQADVMSLGSVLDAIARRFPGRALDAQLGQTGRGPIYRIKWLGQDGRVRDVTVDARTGQILQVR